MQSAVNLDEAFSKDLEKIEIFRREILEEKDRQAIAPKPVTAEGPSPDLIKLETELAASRAESKRLTESLRVSDSRIQELNQRYSILETAQRTFVTSTEAQKTATASLQKTIGGLEQDLADRDKKIKELQDDAETAKTQVAELRTKLTAKEAELKAAKSVKEDVNDNSVQLRSELEKLQERFNTLTVKAKSYYDALTRCREQLGPPKK